MHAGPRTVEPRATPRRDTRVRGMRAHNRETDFRTRTEHNHLNTPGSLKHLKSVVLAPAGLTAEARPESARQTSAMIQRGRL